MKGFKNKKIVKITESHNNTIEDAVAEEKKIRISVNGREVLSLYCSPIMVRELVAGLFISMMRTYLWTSQQRGRCRLKAVPGLPAVWAELHLISP
jgi:hypothetical protein